MTIKHQKISMGHHTLVNTHFFSSVDPKVFSAEYWYAKNAIIGEAKGRGTTLFVQNSDTESWVLRHYRRGGMVAKLLSDQFFYEGLRRTRPFMELNLLHYMQQAGLNVPTPIAAQVCRRGLIYRADLLTVRIPNARDMHHILTHRSLSPAVWEAVGAAVRKMHDAQVYHHDLNIRNIMLDNHDVVWIIDYDRCYQRQGDSWKQQNLARLQRSLLKEQAKAGATAFYWSGADTEAMLRGYGKV